jgi:hypothetical protein
MYFVAEWTTTSTPASMGFWYRGVAQLLSTTVVMFRERARLARRSTSRVRNRMVPGLSNQIIRVDGVNARSIASGSRSSTMSCWTPKRRR